jgi:hypothetical protein
VELCGDDDDVMTMRCVSTSVSAYEWKGSGSKGNTMYRPCIGLGIGSLPLVSTELRFA